MKKLFIIILSVICLNNTSFAVEEEILILFDSTASMLENFGDNPKYITAVKETKQILKTIQPSKPFGLRIIGINMENALDFLVNTDSFCTATKLIEPIKYNNIDNINEKLDLLFPLGTTPLTYSLDKAINNDFSQYSQKHIILITDGGESCNADPCGYIQNIMRTRSDIKIDIIAIGVSGNDLNQLNCLTNYTSGTFINVSTPDELKFALNRIFKPTANKLEKTNRIDNIPFDDNFSQEEIIYKNYLLVE